MNWTSEKPKVPGWYWIRSDDDLTEIVEVKQTTAYDGELRLCIMQRERFTDALKPTPASSEWDDSVQFAGPIPLPSEDPVDERRMRRSGVYVEGCVNGMRALIDMEIKKYALIPEDARLTQTELGIIGARERCGPSINLELHALKPGQTIQIQRGMGGY